MPDLTSRFEEYLKNKNYDAAMTALEVAEMSSDLSACWLQLGIVYTQKHQPQKARQCFLRVLQHTPNHAVALAHTGNACLLENNPLEAIDYFTRAITLAPDEPAMLFSRGKAYAHNGTLDAARQDFQQVLQLSPNHPATLNELVIIEEKTGDFQQAIIYQNKLLAQTPDHPQAQHRLARLYKNTGNRPYAEEILLNLQQTHPDFLPAWNLHAQLHMSTQDWHAATTYLQQALEINAENPVSHALLGKTKLNQGDMSGWTHMQWGRLCGHLRAYPDHYQSLAKNLWQGGAIEGKNILVLSEKTEDTFFYYKYLTLLLRNLSGVNITLECPKKFKPVLHNSFPNLTLCSLDEIVNQENTVPFDTVLFIGDLTPLLFNEALQKPSPYLGIPSGVSHPWRQILAQISGMKIGLLPDISTLPEACHTIHSLYVQALSAIEKNQDHLTLMNCQYEPLPSSHYDGLTSVYSWTKNPSMDTFAGFLSALDIVIGPPCMETHLAAATGVETWFILSDPSRDEWYHLLCNTTSWGNHSRSFQLDANADKDTLITALLEAIKEKQNTVIIRNKASQLINQRRFSLALQCLQPLVSTENSYTTDAEIWMLKGASESYLKRQQEAEKSLRHAVRLQPFWPETLYNLGSFLKDHRKLYEASQLIKQALNLDPKNYSIANTLANVFRDLGQLKDAIAIYSRIVRQTKQRSSHSNLLIALNYDPDTDNKTLFEESIRWGKQHYKATPLSVPDNPQTMHHTKIRIGYISPDFRGHPVAFFIEPLLKQHDKRRFEVFAYSNVHKPDGMTTHLKHYTDHWHDISMLTDEQAARRIQMDHIDILIDLAGHTGGHRLGIFYYRPATVQISYLGYPNTTGLPATDYLITDPVIAPPEESEPYYTERLLYLPNSFFCYQPPALHIPLRPAPVLENGYLTFGVFNNYLMKAHSMMLDLWAGVLQKIPNARLRIQSIPFSEQACCQHMTEEFTQRGISPKRLQLVPAGTFPEYLDAYNDVDIVLDTFPWNGHTTTCHALWMSTPTLTLAGEQHASRMGMSIFNTLNMAQDWVTRSPKTYIEQAQYWHHHRDSLADIKKTLRTTYLASSLCDSKAFTQGFEAILQQAWNRQCTQNKQ